MRTIECKHENNISYLMFIFGILAPAPIISLFSMTFYVIFILFFAVVFASKIIINNIKIRVDDKIYFLFAEWALISYLICSIRMPDLWTNGLLKSIVQFLCLILAYYGIQNQEYNYLKIAFIKGVYISATIQVFWCILQLIVYRIMLIDINIIIFKDLLKMYTGDISTIEYAGYVSGLCWHYSNLAPLFIFGYVYSNKRYMKVLFSVMSLFAGRTLLAGMLVLLLMTAANYVYKKKIDTKTVCITIVIIIAMLLVLALNNEVASRTFDRIGKLLNISKYYSIDPSTNAHINYLIKIPYITHNNDLLTNLFGVGPECSGYIFSKYYGQFAGIKWVLECDYSNILWNYGYVGFILYYFWMIKNIIRCAKLNYKYLLFFIPLMFMGLMYNIILNWTQLLIMFMFSLGKKNISIFSK